MTHQARGEIAMDERRGGGLGLLAAVLAGVVCLAHGATTGEITQFTLTPNCDGLFPVPDGQPAECANCSLRFNVEATVNDSLVQYKLTSTAIEAARCNCSEGLSEFVPTNETSVQIDFAAFGLGYVAEMLPVDGYVVLNATDGDECAVSYNVTKGTVFNINAPQAGIPSSPEVETFAVVLLFISAVSILLVFILAYRSQGKSTKYAELAG